MNEADEIDAPLEQVLQHGMAISAQLGREVARVWQMNMEQKSQMNSREAARLDMAFDSEKQAAVALLAPTQEQQWWDAANPRELINAYRVATAWKDHAPEAAHAEKHLRTEASTRYGIDAKKLAHETAINDSPILDSELAKLAKAQGWAKETGHTDILPSFYPEATRMRNLLNDYEASEAAAKRAEEAATVDREQGDVQNREAADEFGQSRDDNDHAANVDHDGPSAAEEAWYRDLFLTETPEAQEERTQASALRETAEQHDQQGERVLVTAGAAYDSAERQEALADRMRAAGAPEKGIAARQFAESQQKHPISHAAAGKGKTVNKVKTNSPKKNQTQAKQHSR
ncbi:hypothetical protein [Arthrobacter antibioticus]|uniref:hypothetical protein n=1 Tax=Arthrobacter sp. H35-MC1 TaxID=3046203 RepID=UPI0024B8F7A7|nr:hypothetical protein [Arthrobacter sp. H35-MC1]MDJ0318593.1 hypothetical protein [Arthrobacter sp. H35-MC1]